MQKMSMERVLLYVAGLVVLLSPFTTVEGGAESPVCSSLDGALGLLTGKRLPALVCPEKGSGSCCPKKEASLNCSTWHLCPQATLTDASSIHFIHHVPEGVPALQYLTDKCPCAPNTSAPSTLFLVLYPLYGHPTADDTNCPNLEESYAFKLPYLYAGAQIHIGMNHLHTPFTNCCCCLRLDYYLTWSQMRIFGYMPQKHGYYIADWINDYQNFSGRIGHGRWMPNTHCPSSKLDEDSTMASGNAVFTSANFDLNFALDKAALAGFTRRNLTIQFSITVVVALSQYCYKIKGTPAACNYHSDDLTCCVYGTPQVMNILAAGQTSYRQMFDVPASGGSPKPAIAYTQSQEINEEDDIKCLEKFAGNTHWQFHPVEDFNLNSHVRDPHNCEESSAWHYLEPNYFTHEKCNSIK